MSKKIIKQENNCRIINRQEKQKESLIEQLSKAPIIQIACEKLGVARSTIYRWRDEDPKFENRLAEAIGRGRLLINDLAESKLITAIKNGNLSAATYWLKHNHSNYREKKSICTPEDVEPIKVIISGYNSNDQEDNKKYCDD